MLTIDPGSRGSGIPLLSLYRTDEMSKGPAPAQPQQQSPTVLDLRRDPNIVSAVEEIKQNAVPLKQSEKPVLTSIVVVPGQVSSVQGTKLIDAYGNRSSEPFTGTVQPIAVIPLDQGCNIIPAGNGILLQEHVTSVRGPDPGSSDPTPSPDSGVFIDIQNIGRGWPTVEIQQNIKVQQGRIQIESGPNQVIKDAGAGTIIFTKGPQKKRTPEVKAIIDAYGMKTGANFSGTYIPQLGQQFSLKASSITLKALLNRIIRESPLARTWIMSTDNSSRTLNLRMTARHFENSH